MLAQMRPENIEVSIVGDFSPAELDELLLSQTSPLRTIKNFRDAVMGFDRSRRCKRPAGSTLALRFDGSYDTLGSPIMELWKLKAIIDWYGTRRSVPITISGLH